MRTGFTMGDFRAFYCAARVASHGADPVSHRAAALVRDGHRHDALLPEESRRHDSGAASRLRDRGARALSVFPFAVAATLWGALLLLRMARVHPWRSRASRGFRGRAPSRCFALSLGVVSLPLGEVVPIALAFICLRRVLRVAGAFAGRGASRRVGAMIEPHLGLPVCISLAVWNPATRLPIAVAFGALAATSLVAARPGGERRVFHERAAGARAVGDRRATRSTASPRC